MRLITLQGIKLLYLKDKRYRAIKSLIETKGIQELRDVFTITPLSVVKGDMKINYNTLRRRIHRTDLLTLKDILEIAALVEVDPIEIFRLAVTDFNKYIKSPPKKK
jgi:hypothetical protein